MSVRVSVFSDEVLLLDAARRLLEGMPGVVVEFAETRLSSLTAAMIRCQPDVLLFDFSPEADLSFLAALRDAAPCCRIVVWTRTLSTELAWQAIELGIKGILPKTAPPEVIVQCMERVAADEAWFDHSLTTTLLTSRPIRLTNRESQLVGLLAQGLKNKEIATMLKISEGTVKVYLSRLFEKVGAKDRFELALFGLKNLRNVAANTPRGVTLPIAQNLRSIVLRRHV